MNKLNKILFFVIGLLNFNGNMITMESSLSSGNIVIMESTTKVNLNIETINFIQLIKNDINEIKNILKEDYMTLKNVLSEIEISELITTTFNDIFQEYINIYINKLENIQSQDNYEEAQKIYNLYQNNKEILLKNYHSRNTTIQRYLFINQKIQSAIDIQMKECDRYKNLLKQIENNLQIEFINEKFHEIKKLYEKQLNLHKISYKNYVLIYSGLNLEDKEKKIVLLLKNIDNCFEKEYINFHNLIILMIQELRLNLNNKIQDSNEQLKFLKSNKNSFDISKIFNFFKEICIKKLQNKLYQNFEEITRIYINKIKKIIDKNKLTLYDKIFREESIRRFDLILYLMNIKKNFEKNFNEFDKIKSISQISELEIIYDNKLKLFDTDISTINPNSYDEGQQKILNENINEIIKQWDNIIKKKGEEACDKYLNIKTHQIYNESIQYASDQYLLSTNDESIISLYGLNNVNPNDTIAETKKLYDILYEKLYEKLNAAINPLKINLSKIKSLNQLKKDKEDLENQFNGIVQNTINYTIKQFLKGFIDEDNSEDHNFTEIMSELDSSIDKSEHDNQENNNKKILMNLLEEIQTKIIKLNELITPSINTLRDEIFNIIKLQKQSQKQSQNKFNENKTILINSFKTFYQLIINNIKNIENTIKKDKQKITEGLLPNEDVSKYKNQEIQKEIISSINKLINDLYEELLKIIILSTDQENLKDLLLIKFKNLITKEIKI